MWFISDYLAISACFCEISDIIDDSSGDDYHPSTADDVLDSTDGDLFDNEDKTAISLTLEDSWWGMIFDVFTDKRPDLVPPLDDATADGIPLYLLIA